MPSFYKVILISFMVFLGLVMISWVGYLGSDDVTYANGAYGWINEFPFVGGHGTIRYTITIPMALTFIFLGENELCLALPTILYCLGLLGIIAYLINKEFSVGYMAAVLLFFVTSPMLVIWSSIASIDIVEAFFVFSAVVVFYFSIKGTVSSKGLFITGALCGVGFVTRETAIFIAPFFVLLFVFGYKIPRKYYLLIAVGFFSVWAIELLYLTVMTGDPLYRVNISLNHDSAIDRSIDKAGNVLLHPFIDPLFVLLLNQEFGILFWFAIPLGVWLYKTSDSLHDKNFFLVFGIFAIVWFVCASLATTLLPLNPRYFMVSSLVAIMFLGIGLLKIYNLGYYKKSVLGIMLAVVSINLLSLYIENKSLLFGEKAMMTFVKNNLNETIYTDPMTKYRARLLLKWQGLDEFVKVDEQPLNGIYIYNPARALHVNWLMAKEKKVYFQPKNSWVLIKKMSPEPRLLGQIILKLGLKYIIPLSLWDNIYIQHEGIEIYRIKG
ncbi:glycosyltransferase family 39 protein [Colwellia sp. MT41]|uniref:glycosyltransferase family 39 protein n=1 Tax=Colwellia sp. MT41 TaxID=58049 RepID=UPI000AD04B82|nr:glycosyltransferase family 39 protein [Colwellia sp. MT41]